MLPSSSPLAGGADVSAGPLDLRLVDRSGCGVVLVLFFGGI